MKTATYFTIIIFLICYQLNASHFNNTLFQPKEQRNYLQPLKGNSDEGIKGKFLIGAGAGFNIWGTTMSVRYIGSEFWSSRDYGNISGRSNPMINVSVDYGIIKNLSAGVAFGYQQATITISDYYYNSNLKYVDTWTRMHFAARVDYHIIAKENISLYTGLKFGYNTYSFTSTASPIYAPYKAELDVYPNPYSVQAHFGFSYYFVDMIGFNTEIGIGIGGPYIGAIGVALKL